MNLWLSRASVPVPVGVGCWLTGFGGKLGVLGVTPSALCGWKLVGVCACAGVGV